MHFHYIRGYGSIPMLRSSRVNLGESKEKIGKHLRETRLVWNLGRSVKNLVEVIIKVSRKFHETLRNSSFLKNRIQDTIRIPRVRGIW